MRHAVGAIQKLSNGQRGEGVNDFVIVMFILRDIVDFTRQLRNGRHKIWDLKEYVLGFLVRYKIIRMKFMDQISPLKITTDNFLI